MPVPHSCQPSVAASDRPQAAPPAPAAPDLVQDVPATASGEESVPTPRPLSLVGGDTIEAPLATQSSSSSPDEVVAEPSRASPPDDFCENQDLLHKVAANLGLKVEEMEEQTDKLFNVFSASAPTQVALPVHKGLLNIAKAILHPANLEKGGNKYFAPAKGFEYLYTYPPSGSLVVSVANERDKRGPTSSTPKNKEVKR